MTGNVVPFVAMADLPNRIREFRKAAGFTLEQLGDMVGTSHVNVSELERGVRNLKHHWMVRFAAALGVSPADLLPVEQNSDSLSPEERGLIARFRRGDPAQRAQLLSMAEIVIPDAPPASPAKRSKAA